MSDKMREFVDEVKQLCKDFSDQRDRPYMGDVHAALDGLYEQWQAAQSEQSVPVVGEPVAWVVNTPIRNLHFSKSEEIGLGGATQEPLYRASTHSIPAAELATLREKAAEADELRKDAERYRWLRDGNSIQIFGVHELWTTSHRLDAVIDAAIAHGKGE